MEPVMSEGTGVGSVSVQMSSSSGADGSQAACLYFLFETEPSTGPEATHLLHEEQSGVHSIHVTARFNLTNVNGLTSRLQSQMKTSHRSRLGGRVNSHHLLQSSVQHGG